MSLCPNTFSQARASLQPSRNPLTSIFLSIKSLSYEPKLSPAGAYENNDTISPSIKPRDRRLASVDFRFADSGKVFEYIVKPLEGSQTVFQSSKNGESLLQQSVRVIPATLRVQVLHKSKNTSLETALRGETDFVEK
jgi:hypothetical protein